MFSASDDDAEVLLRRREDVPLVGQAEPHPEDEAQGPGFWRDDPEAGVDARVEDGERLLRVRRGSVQRN